MYFKWQQFRFQEASHYIPCDPGAAVSVIELGWDHKNLAIGLALPRLCPWISWSPNITRCRGGLIIFKPKQHGSFFFCVFPPCFPRWHTSWYTSTLLNCLKVIKIYLIQSNERNRISWVNWVALTSDYFLKNLVNLYSCSSHLKVQQIIKKPNSVNLN